MFRPRIDQELVRHCLEDLTGRSCPIVTERTRAFQPSEACDGRSIRATLFDFAVEASVEVLTTSSKKRRHELRGQIAALTYAVALIDNPYRVDTGSVELRIRLEVEKAFDPK